MASRVRELGEIRVRRRQRCVQNTKKPMVLPEAHAEGDRERERAHDQPGAQLAEVVDDAEAILVPDRSEDPRHYRWS
jgi:hypothetical protein